MIGSVRGLLDDAEDTEYGQYVDYSYYVDGEYPDGDPADAPPDSPIPDWGCAVEYGLVWCDGVCIPASDDHCCAKRCGPDVIPALVEGEEDEIVCTNRCINTDSTPGCCHSRGMDWCDRTYECEEQVGRCIGKGEEPNFNCASTCSVATSSDGTETLECSSGTSRGYEFTTADCGQGTCPTWRNRVPKRPRRWP